MIHRHTITRNITKQLSLRRTYVDAGIKQPKFVKTDLTNHERPAPQSSSSLKNGINGEKVFPAGTVAPNTKRGFKSAVMALGAVVGILYFWPQFVANASDTVKSVPDRERTAAVQLKNGEAQVTIPQTYARLDKPKDDDE